MKLMVTSFECVFSRKVSIGRITEWYVGKRIRRKLWQPEFCVCIRNFESNQHFVLIVLILFGGSGSKDSNVIIVNSLFISQVFKLAHSQSQTISVRPIWNFNLKTTRSDVKNLSLSAVQKCYQQRYQIMTPNRHIHSKEIIRI